MDEAVLIEAGDRVGDEGPAGERVEVGDWIPVRVDDVIDATTLGIGERGRLGAAEGETHHQTVNAESGHLSNGLSACFMMNLIHDRRGRS